MFSGFTLNDAESDVGEALYLEDLNAAHIDINLGLPGLGMVISLNNFIPPVAHSYWSYINVNRVTGDIDSNWPYWPY